MTPEDVLQKIEQNSGFVWVKKKLSFQEVEAVKDLVIMDLFFRKKAEGLP